MDSLLLDFLPDVQSVEDCLDICQDNDECEYFTYYAYDYTCLTFANCETFSTDSCSECFSGSRECEGRIQ